MSCLRRYCVLVVTLVVAGCLNLGGDWSSTEVSRATSPGGSVDAVLFEENGGATTSFAYSVYVVPRGHVVRPDADSAAATFYGVTQSDSAYGLNLRWHDQQTLYLEYLYSPRTRLPEPFVKVGDQAIHIVRRKEVANAKAPRGGMLWNLQGRPR
jgi:hypothetical protein